MTLGGPVVHFPATQFSGSWSSPGRWASGDLELALVVKAADRLANMRACVADGKDELLGVYKQEHASGEHSPCSLTSSATASRCT